MPKITTKGGVEFTCDECGQVCKAFNCHYRQSKNHFCSQTCSSRFLVTKAENDLSRGIKNIAKGSHTSEEWGKVLQSFENKCSMCESKGKLVKDHIKSLSEGGTNFIENIRPICRLCSSKKFCRGLNDDFK